MHRLWLWVGLLAILTAGCQRKMFVESEMGVVLRSPIQAHVQAETSLMQDPGPLLETFVPGGEGPTCKQKVVIIDVDGVLWNTNYVGPYSAGENPVALFKEKLQSAANDPMVCALVLRINSSGGCVAATDVMWHDLQAFREQAKKPVVACLLDVGAGGAYYLATASDAIIALPTSMVGGIGVLLNLYYAHLAMETHNFFDVSVREGKSIDMGSPVRKLSDDEKKMFEKMAKEYHARFKNIVVQERPKVKKDAECFDGRIMSAHDAAQEGLVDSIGYLQDAVGLACQLAKIERAQTVLYRRKGDGARTVYATTSNRPLSSNMMPFSIPGLDRARLPLFVYMWQTDPTLLRVTGY